MNTRSPVPSKIYREAMGQLLVLYTQVDRLIMEICAERIAKAPDEDARLSLAVMLPSSAGGWRSSAPIPHP